MCVWTCVGCLLESAQLKVMEDQLENLKSVGDVSSLGRSLLFY